jgi:cytochrome c-type biogenesis protein CcmH/NrfG/uncharacterized protein (AIM24 family)
MRGRGSFGDREGEAESRRLTPSIGLAPESDVPSDAANEDFLFHLYRGSELLQDNRVHEAKEELERALHLQPRDAKGQDLLGVVYFRLGLYPRAIAIYEQLRRKNPRDGALLLNLALCYLKTGQPALARRDLETLLASNPTHGRAWGYLGLACERLGDLGNAQRAFERGGHTAMAKRIAERRATSTSVVPGSEGGAANREVREVVAAAFEELDAGELSFELAQPASDSHSNDAAAQSWRPVELGQHASRVIRDASPGSGGALDSKKPDTKDGPPPPPAVAIPHLASPAMSRRPTLIAPAAPAPTGENVDAFPPSRPPTFTVDETGAPSLQRTVVAVPPVRKQTRDMEAPQEAEPRKKTLPPPSVAKPATSPPPAAQLARDSFVAFPQPGSVVIHPSGVALVRTAPETGFAARLEAIRASSNGLTMKMLERQAKGKPTGESFGGVGSPVVSATGDGQLVLAPRAGRRLSAFALDGDMCFVREEVLLGFDGELTFENGRLATGEGEFVAVVSLKGNGAVLLEAIGEILTLAVQPNKGLSVRREVVLGWFGRLVPRALAPSEAPCGQRGLVSFAGEGRVLVASA